MRRQALLFAPLLLTGCLSAEPGGVPPGLADSDLGDESLSVEQLALEFEGEGGWLVSPVNAASSEGVSRVTVFVELEELGEVAIEGRAVYEDGRVGEWRPLGTSWMESTMLVAFADVEPSFGAQIRLRESDADRLAVLRWSATLPSSVDPETSPEDDADLAAAREPLIASLRPLGIVERGAWRARTARCTNRDRTARYRLAIHHTSSPSTGDVAARIRGFQAYHMDSRGWCDVGYHFLIGSDGTIYEGRPLDLLGTHVRSNNSGNVGIALVGCFEPSNCSPRSRWGSSTPTDAMIGSASRLVAALADRFGIARSATTVRGHRQHAGQSTDCPGINVLDRMSEIRSGRLVGDPPPPPGPAGSCVHSGGGTYGAAGCSAGYQCCGGTWRTRAAGCGACACVEESGRIGCTAALPPPPPPPPPAGASCTHSFGGTYADAACSTSYQCCDGSWEMRGSCGACACVEETGRSGCDASAPPPPPPPTTEPPPGASCLHTFGGPYANTACSAGYQCCDGAFRTRGAGGCGECFCVEETGRLGCGLSSTPPPVGGGIHGGLTQAGSEIPRAGLANATLRGALGVSTEPYGDVVTDSGASWARGRVSHFGGPSDRGVSSTETGAITGERLRSLNNPESPSSSTLRTRPEDYYYVAMRWNYSPNGRSFWRDARILVRNPATGARVVVRPVDWGPHTRTRRIVDLSPQALRDLAVTTDDLVDVAFAAPGTPLGVVGR